MKYLVLESTDPYYNLAIEEYLFNTADDEIFMLWRNEPTVVIGKNQNAYAEINFEYLKANNIHVARRITGGGAVYHDLGNLNYTFISPNRGSEGIDFKYFTKPIIDALAQLGVEATLGGRNDLTVGERKFSGNAQHSNGEKVLHHGTLLFNSDLEVLNSVLIFNEEKYKTKAVKSNRSRVLNLSELIKNLSIDDFISLLTDILIKEYSPKVISISENPEIRALEERNRSFAWLYPDRDMLSRYSILRKHKYPFGLVSLRLNMCRDVIADIKIEGDFFGNKNCVELEQTLIGNTFEECKFILDKISLSDYISGMSSTEFVELMTINATT